MNDKFFNSVMSLKLLSDRLGVLKMVNDQFVSDCIKPLVDSESNLTAPLLLLVDSSSETILAINKMVTALDGILNRLCKNKLEENNLKTECGLKEGLVLSDRKTSTEMFEKEISAGG